MTSKATKATKALPAFPAGRGSGRTQWMIDRLAEAVKAGQPYSFVIGRDFKHATELFRRVAETFGRDSIETFFRRKEIVFDGSRIVFVSRHQFEERRQGHRGYGEFWDHWADGIE